ncbi:UNVERIFIED_CONTAM: hypothetical protein RMT77_007547 [Armadillidium vulgare]
MDLQAQLVCGKKEYMIVKALQTAFLIYLLVVKPDFEANSTFSTTNQCSLAIVLISWGFLYFKYRALFSQHVYYKEYLKLIVWDVFNFCLTTGGYSVSIYNINLEYDDLKTKFYSQYVKDSNGLKMNKMNRFSRRLDYEPIDEHIEATSKLMVEKVLDIGSDLLSFMNITENPSEFIDTRVNGNEITSSKISEKLFEDFYNYNYNFILYTSLFSSLCNFGVVASLGWIEFVKYRIRKAPQPGQAIEMVAMNNAVDEAMNNAEDDD